MKPLLGLLLAVGLQVGCSSVAMRGHDAAAHPQPAVQWVRSELYFGIGEAGQVAAAGERRWREFLDAEVTPRFPEGLTVVEGYGQWRSPGAEAVERLASKVLVVVHEDTPQRRADIEAIRAAWRRLSGDESVLWARQPVDVSF
ncbi:MAG: DUF3574 domain-containing protein [Luteimonas sp.]|nr:DUF3574 domain-containing protein [Luteimonas sp.]